MIAAPSRSLDDLRYFAQGVVALVVTMVFVEVTEVVDVKKNHGAVFRANRWPAATCVQHLVQSSATAKARERIQLNQHL